MIVLVYAIQYPGGHNALVMGQGNRKRKKPDPPAPPLEKEEEVEELGGNVTAPSAKRRKLNDDSALGTHPPEAGTESSQVEGGRQPPTAASTSPPTEARENTDPEAQPEPQPQPQPQPERRPPSQANTRPPSGQQLYESIPEAERQALGNAGGGKGSKPSDEDVQDDLDIRRAQDAAGQFVGNAFSPEQLRLMNSQRPGVVQQGGKGSNPHRGNQNRPRGRPAAGRGGQSGQRQGQMIQQSHGVANQQANMDQGNGGNPRGQMVSANQGQQWIASANPANAAIPAQTMNQYAMALGQQNGNPNVPQGLNRQMQQMVTSAHPIPTSLLN